MAPAQDDWASATSIADVLARMDEIDATLPAADGVATFNRMYRRVTELVQRATEADQFGAGEFVERLDVRFANLFFEAHQADCHGTPIPTAWAPLFEARGREHTAPIQFALAGMNAHISHDLPFAVVSTCQELGVEPDDDAPEHHDFTQINRVLEAASGEIKAWFSNGLVAQMDELGGKLDDGFAIFGIEANRAIAWQNAQLLWRLGDNPRLYALFVDGLTRSVELANRGILL